jgi:hypothetical protein
LRTSKGTKSFASFGPHLEVIRADYAQTRESKKMTTKKEALQRLRKEGHTAIADDLQAWSNSDGTAGGWDGYIHRFYPHVVPVLWPGEAPHARPARTPKSSVSDDAPIMDDAPIVLPDGRTPRFDAYLMVDWSARNVRAWGPDSLWFALLRWQGREAITSTHNCLVRADFASCVEALLAERRVLVGFDFPLGYPRGFCSALGLSAPSGLEWLKVWEELDRRIVDGTDNANNRFEVAAALNAQIHGSFGPFFGRPAKTSPGIARTLSGKQKGVFKFPVLASTGVELARQRVVDERADTASSAWFLYGGANTVGSQALVGIPHVLKLRRSISQCQVWPFETGARLPETARVVLAEIYPSRFHQRIALDDRSNDERQVIAMARYFAKLDASDALAPLFQAPGREHAAVQREEGWILGVS